MLTAINYLLVLLPLCEPQTKTHSLNFRASHCFTFLGSQLLAIQHNKWVQPPDSCSDQPLPCSPLNLLLLQSALTHPPSYTMLVAPCRPRGCWIKWVATKSSSSVHVFFKAQYFHNRGRTSRLQQGLSNWSNTLPLSQLALCYWGNTKTFPIWVVRRRQATLSAAPL